MHRALAATVVSLFATVGFSQIHLGLSNSFQDGEMAGWGGPSAFNNPDGGPNGAGDRFLDVVSDGSGSGGRLATHNTTDWLGNYQAAGVTGVSMMLRNFNSVALEMRIVLFDAVSHARWTSSTPVNLAPNSGWTLATFSFAENDLTRVQGTSSYQDVITNVERFMIRHDAGSPSAGGSAITGEMGIDNIQAVPEPATIAALTIGTLAIVRRRKLKA